VGIEYLHVIDGDDNLEELGGTRGGRLEQQQQKY
jgi:hypothetical protein